MTGLVVTIIALLVVAAIIIYNRLVRARNIVAEAWAGIDVQLQRRHELVPNLVTVTREYVKHEASVLENVTRARGAGVADATADVPGRGRMATLSTHESELSRALGQLFALAEAYPDLKAATTFAQLHDSLVEVEDKLQYARRYYNGAVRDLNNRVESFPSNLVAGVFKFESAPFFEIELASRREAPDVRL